MTFGYIILATLIISLISLIGVITLYFKEHFLNKILFVLVSLSIGALMGGAFLHLIPEALEINENMLIYVLGGFFSFFFIEKGFHWRHCHNAKCKEKVHSFAYMNLLGDAIHNFVDGIIIAGSFIAGPFVGIVSTTAIALHEIPQELGDFGVLVYAGFTRKSALVYNFLIALTAVAGGILGFFLLNIFENLMPFLLALGAGGFIYIAATDLLPEIKKQDKLKNTLINILIMTLGVLIIYSLEIFFSHGH